MTLTEIRNLYPQYVFEHKESSKFDLVVTRSGITFIIDAIIPCLYADGYIIVPGKTITTTSLDFGILCLESFFKNHPHLNDELYKLIKPIF